MAFLRSGPPATRPRTAAPSSTAPRPTERPGRWRETLLVVTGFLGLTVLLTWPVAAHLGTTVAAFPYFDQIRVIHPDTYLTTWIVGWGARAMLSAPSRVFDAGIFHPADDALAYSEHMFGVLPITLPIYLITGDVVVTHQVLLLASFVLSGVFAYLLVREWTGSRMGGLVAGMVFAFAPWRFRNLPQLHLLDTFYLPLVVLFASRWLRGGGWPALLAAATALFLQALCAYSIAYAVCAAVVPFAVVHAWTVGAPWRRTAALLLGFGASLAVVAAVSLPYLGALGRDVAPVIAAAAPDLMLGRWGTTLAGWLDPQTYFFLGYATCALAGAGLVAAAWKRHEAAAGGVPSGTIVASAFAMLVPLALLSVGPVNAPVLQPLWDAVPGLAHYRVPWRFAFQMPLALALLAGLAAATVDIRFGERSPGLVGVATAAAVAALCGQVWARIPTLEIRGRAAVPPVYAWLARQTSPADAAMLEVPAGTVEHRAYADPEYVYWSLYHGHRLVNGYSGYRPGGYSVLLDLVEQLPNADALAAIRRLTGPAWIVVHLSELDDTARKRWSDPGPLREVARFDGDVVFAVEPPDLDWRERYLHPPPDASLSGTPVRELSSGKFIATLEAPSDAVAGAAVPLRVRIQNFGHEAWPSLAGNIPGRVVLRLSWSESGSTTRVAATDVMLPKDLRAGWFTDVDVTVRAPDRPGRYDLSASVRQGNRALERLNPTGATASVAVAPKR